MAAYQYRQPETFNNEDDRCNSKTCGAMVAGAALLLFGLASIGVGIAIGTVYGGVVWFYTYAPIWAGVVYTIAGALGVSTFCCFGNKEGLKCTLIAFLVMCIFAVLAGGAQVIAEGFWAGGLYHVFAPDCSLDQIFFTTNGCTNTNLDLYAAHTSAAALGGVACITALIGSILVCVGFCNGGSNYATGGTTVIVQGGSQPTQGGYPMNTVNGAQQGGYGGGYGGAGYAQSPPQYNSPYGQQQPNYDGYV